MGTTYESIHNKQVQATEERRIVSALITSDEFCEQIIPKAHKEYFTSVHLRRIAGWCVHFYNTYKRAPQKHIEDIFIDKSRTLEEVEKELIAILLKQILEQCDDSFSRNIEYLTESAINYFRRRALEIHKNNVSILIEQDRLLEAEAEIEHFQRISLELDDSLYIDPGDLNQRIQLYEKYEKRQKEFFQFPGDLGEFIGNIKPGDLIGITAPAKVGKSMLLNDFMKHLILQKRRVVKWAIEMTDVEEIVRFDKLFYPTVNKDSGEYYYPVFDCVKNQTGACGDRNSRVTVRSRDTDIFTYHKEHIPCTKCRYAESERFVPCTYVQAISRDKGIGQEIATELEYYKEMLTKYARIVVRPKYTLTYDLMMYDLDRLYIKYNFIPQALLIDYIDILNIGSKFNDYREEDEKWKLMQKLASATKCVVITPTQSNKAGATAYTLKQTDQGGFYGKGRHVNLMLGINQTPEEKLQGMYRINILDGRDIRTNPNDFCIVLQDLKTGQMHLDSYWPNKNYSF